jgi:hypothetical protein
MTSGVRDRQYPPWPTRTPDNSKGSVIKFVMTQSSPKLASPVVYDQAIFLSACENRTTSNLFESSENPFWHATLAFRTSNPMIDVVAIVFIF